MKTIFFKNLFFYDLQHASLLKGKIATQLTSVLKPTITVVKFSIGANEQVLPIVGKLKNVRLATEVHYLFKDEKFILMFKRVSPAGTKAK